jgi:hypothetical protein
MISIKMNALHTKTEEKNTLFWHPWASCIFHVLIKQNKKSFYRTIQWTFLPRLVPIGSNISEKEIKYIQKTSFMTPLNLLLLSCTSDQQKTTLTSYRIFQWTFLPNLIPLAQWFERIRLKCKSLQTTTENKWG